MRGVVAQLGLVALWMSRPAPSPAQTLPGSTDLGKQLSGYNMVISQGVNQLAYRWEEACKGRDGAAVAELYGKDAPILTGAGEVVRGREAVRQLFARSLPRLSDMRLLLYDITASGQLAYVTGNLSYTVSMPSGSGGYQVRVPFSMAMRQGWDNEWRIEAQTGGRLPPFIEKAADFGPQGAPGTGDTIGVRLVDASGRGLAGELVWFEVLAGGGSVTPSLAHTDSTGRAVVYAALGAQPGLNAFRARAAALGEEPISFSLTSEGGGSKAAARLPGDDSLRVQVTDVQGRPVAGVPVAFLVKGWAGSVLLDSMHTDHAGLAATSVMAGEQPDTRAIEARVLGLQPAVFTITRIHRPSP